MISAPYSQLAKIYDKVMSHVNYKMWAEYINNLFQFSDIKIRDILDISCGTGKHVKFLSKRKRHMFGADISLDMLKAARKNKKNGPALIVNDACITAFKNNSFDVIIMLYDSINYLITVQEVENLFDEIFRIIRPGGIFIFDFVTREGLKGCVNGYYESNTWHGLAYERKSWFSKESKIQHNDFVFLYRGKSFKESHIQYIRDIDEWRTLVKKSNMHLSHEFSNFSFLTPDKFSERIHFICKKI